MHSFARQAVRWPLAITLMVLGACADEPVAPTFSSPLKPNAALGDVFVVTNTNDSGIGSLRWALSFTTGGEIIRFDAGLGGKTIAIDSALYIQKSVTIEGPKADGITIRGPGNGRMIWARFPGYVTFRNVSITGGHTINGVGSAIYAESDVTFENSTVYDNVADAGVAIYGEHVTLINSTVSGTIKGNTNTYDYPAVMGDTITLINSTVANNGWGGVGAFNGVITLRNSVVANNAAKNCVILSLGTINRQGANISDDDSCGGPSEITIADPKLGPLADNGGPTMTQALLAGSPAINGSVGCSVQVDQRYAVRDALCDLGSFEFVDFTTVTLTVDPTGIVRQEGWAVISGTVKCSRTESFKVAVELHQPQRIGRETVDVHSAATVPIACDTSVRPWSASMYLTEGSFQNGGAAATAVTFDAEPWVAQALASTQVKLFSRPACGVDGRASPSRPGDSGPSRGVRRRGQSGRLWNGSTNPEENADSPSSVAAGDYFDSPSTRARYLGRSMMSGSVNRSGCHSRVEISVSGAMSLGCHRSTWRLSTSTTQYSGTFFR